MTSYCVYLCYSALASEPTEYRCNPRGAYAGDGKASEVASTVLTLASVAYSAVRAGSSDFFGGTLGDGDGDGSSYAALSGAEMGGGTDADAADADSEDDVGGAASYPSGPVSYSYSFFHFIFALASMFLAMLMTGVGAGRLQGGGEGGRRVGERVGEDVQRVGDRGVVHVEPHRPGALPGQGVHVGDTHTGASLCKIDYFTEINARLDFIYTIATCSPSRNRRSPGFEGRTGWYPCCSSSGTCW